MLRACDRETSQSERCGISTNTHARDITAPGWEKKNILCFELERFTSDLSSKLLQRELFMCKFQSDNYSQQATVEMNAEIFLQHRPKA